MLARLFLILPLLLVLSACSTTEEPSMTEDLMVGEREQITTTPADGIDSVYEQQLVNGAVPGSQQDLEVNVGDRVLFDYDSYALSSEARDILIAQAKWLQSYPSLYVTVEGHADERGTREYNLALGERRASAVKGYLVALGVNPSRVNVISYGKERPAVPGSNPAAWAQNRRAVAVVE